MRNGWLISALVSVAVVTARWEQFALVEAGQVRSHIVIGAKATEVERFAAEELQHYVGEITRNDGAGDGAKLPILTADASRPAVACEILVGRPETNPAVAKVCAVVCERSFSFFHRTSYPVAV